MAIIKCDFMGFILSTESLQPYLSSRISQHTRSTIVLSMYVVRIWPVEAPFSALITQL